VRTHGRNETFPVKPTFRDIVSDQPDDYFDSKWDMTRQEKDKP
jgi:hypothetical protein